MTAAGAVLVAVGVLLSAVAAVGVLRLGDVLLRANAAAKASSLGVVLLLAGIVLLDPSPRSAVVLGLAALLLLVTGSVAGHVIGHAAYRAGVPLQPGTRREGQGAADPRSPEPRDP